MLGDGQGKLIQEWLIKSKTIAYSGKNSASNIRVSYDAISTIVPQKLEMLQGSNSRVIWLKFEDYKVQTDIRNEIQLISCKRSR